MTQFPTKTDASTLVYVYGRDDMPTMDGDSMPGITDDGDSYTTPAVTVPANLDNPYIIRQSDPTGTVFIAVGGIVGFILLVFIIFHLIKSYAAARMAKKTLDSDKLMYETYNNNNTTAYGVSSPPNDMYKGEMQQSVTKLPLLSHHPSKSVLSGLNSGSVNGDTSTLYVSETGATSKHDLTKMFISPTAEAMHQNRNRSSQFYGSSTNLTLPGGGSSQNLSNINLANPYAAGQRQSSYIPSVHVYNETITSDSPSESSRIASQRHASVDGSPANNRRVIPSMYLEDLIDGPSKGPSRR